MKAKRFLSGALIVMLQLMTFAPIQAQASVSFERVGSDDTCTTHEQVFTSNGSEIDIATDLNVVESYTDSRHTAAIADAIWVWPTAETTDAKNGESVTIARDFVVVGTPMGGSIDIAVDNAYKVYVNGNIIGQDDDSTVDPSAYNPFIGEEVPYNFTASGQDTYAIPASALKTGINTIVIEATNWSSSYTDPKTNPAGIMYSLMTNSQECEPIVCELTVTSDSLTTAHGSQSGAVSAYTDARHTADINDAEWIWTTAETVDAKNGETQEFSRTFSVGLDTIESAKLEIAADNAYVVTINGTEFGGDDDSTVDPSAYNPFIGEEVPYNFTASGQDIWDISSLITTGVNTVHFQVRNWTSSYTDPKANPAAFIYKLTARAEVEGTTCEATDHPPVITVIGDNPLTITEGDDFTDPGVIANDMEDGDITVDIVAGGDTVDNNTPGTYVITYDVTDSDSNDAVQKSRTVIVEPKEITGNVCTLEDSAKTTIVDFENFRLYATQANKKETAQFPVSLPAGDYSVSLQTYDGYTDRSSTVPQIYESMAVRFLDTNDSEVVVSSETPDLEDRVEEAYFAGEVDSVLTIATDITSVQAFHAYFGESRAHSVEAVCGAFTSLEEAENQKPVITVDPETVTVTIGEGYGILNGVTADDLEDGDITIDIVTGGDTFDPNTLGTYTITYNVVDSEGLAADQKTRTIHVVEDGSNNGSLTVCKILLDEEGDVITNPNNGEDFLLGMINGEAGASLAQRVESGVLNYGRRLDPIAGHAFLTPLTLTHDLLGDDQILDAECYTFNNFTDNAHIYYGEEYAEDGTSGGLVDELSAFESPLYSDNADLNDFKLSDAFAYSNELFDGISGNSGSRNLASDGHMVLTDSNPHQSLVIVNQLASPEIGEIPVITVDPEVINLFVDDVTAGIDTLEGVTADDFEDGDITADLIANGDVDPTPGTYVVTYDVTDSDSNDAVQKSRIYKVFKNPTTLTCDLITEKDGWYGQYFNYPQAHPAMEPASDDNYGDPLSADEPWTQDWYNEAHYRMDGIETSLDFGSDFFPFDGSDFEEEMIAGHEFYFGAYYQAKVIAPTPGNYAVTYSSDDDMWVYVDGVLVINNSGTQTATSKNDTIALTGENIVEVFYADRKQPSAELSFGFDSDALTILAINQECEQSDEIPVITVDPEVITITVGSTLPNILDGVTATDFEDGDITSDLTTGGDTVDNNTVGTYVVTYDVTDSDSNDAVQKSRTYNVVPQNGGGDNPPILTLVGDNPIVIYTNNPFTDPGATADDIEDGDITSEIVVGGDTVVTNQPNSFTITYDVSDSDGNAATQVTRIVEVRNVGGGCSGNCGGYNPNTKPVITLEGDEPLQIQVGQFFIEPGYVADDKEDGVITPDVVIGGDTVDTDTIGTYVITYNVKDSKGLAADQVTRTVLVGSVLGVSFPNCNLYFTEWLQVGDRGAEVEKMQAWLNEWFNTGLVVDGIYGSKTAAAVGIFQTQDKYAAIILTPWGYTESTDRWYKTTRKTANWLMGCPEGADLLEDVGRYWQTTDEYTGWVDEKTAATTADIIDRTQS